MTTLKLLKNDNVNDSTFNEDLKSLILNKEDIVFIKEFLKFTLSDKSEENLIFLIYVTAYIKNFSRNYFDFIVDNFIKPGSRYVINLPSEESNTILNYAKNLPPGNSPTYFQPQNIPASGRQRRGAVLHTINPAIFNNAFHTICTALARDVYDRFKKTLHMQSLPSKNNFFMRNEKYFSEIFHTQTEQPVISQLTWLVFDGLRNDTQSKNLTIPIEILNLKKSDFSIAPSSTSGAATSSGSYNSDW